MQSVIKSVVKRYIFESQKDESSPIEGEIEELKQDLSSFRFEMLNQLETQWRSLQDTVNYISTRLDGAPRAQLGPDNLPKSPHSDLSDRSDMGPSARRVADWQYQEVPPTDVEHSLESTGLHQRAPSETDSVINGDQGLTVDIVFPGSSNSSVVEEEIIPQNTNYDTERTIPRRPRGSSLDSLQDLTKDHKFSRKRARSQRGRQGSLTFIPTSPSPVQVQSLPVFTPPSPPQQETSTGYKPKYVKGDLEGFVRVWESSC